MTVTRRLVFLVWFVAAAAVAWACVGDNPGAGTPAPADSGTTDTGGGSSSGAPDSGDPDANGTPCVGGGITCDGKCVDPKTDEKNCGRCVHDCGNGECTDGVCKHVPVVPNAMPDGGVGITSLQTDQSDDDPKGLAQRVFWSVVAFNLAAGVYQDNVLGGNTVKLSKTSVHARTNVVVDQTTVYWSANDFGAGQHPIWKGTVNDDASETAWSIMNLGSVVQSISLDPTTKNVVGSYVGGSGTGVGAFKCAPAGGTCTTLGSSFTGSPTGNVALDASNIYFADDQGVIHRNELATANGASYTQNEATPNLLRVDGNALFWTTKGDKKIKRGGLGNPGTIVPLATTANEATGLAADGVNVYWTDSVLGTVNYAPRTGTGPNTAYVTLGPSSIAMRLVRDSGFLYFTHNGGIYRVALP